MVVWRKTFLLQTFFLIFNVFFPSLSRGCSRTLTHTWLQTWSLWSLLWMMSGQNVKHNTYNSAPHRFLPMFMFMLSQLPWCCPKPARCLVCGSLSSLLGRGSNLWSCVLCSTDGVWWSALCTGADVHPLWNQTAVLPEPVQHRAGLHRYLTCTRTQIWVSFIFSTFLWKLKNWKKSNVCEHHCWMSMLSGGNLNWLYSYAEGEFQRMYIRCWMCWATLGILLKLLQSGTIVVTLSF